MPTTTNLFIQTDTKRHRLARLVWASKRLAMTICRARLLLNGDQAPLGACLGRHRSHADRRLALRREILERNVFKVQSPGHLP
jgi:hypothetical protein